MPKELTLSVVLDDDTERLPLSIINIDYALDKIRLSSFEVLIPIEVNESFSRFLPDIAYCHPDDLHRRIKGRHTFFVRDGYRIPVQHIKEALSHRKKQTEAVFVMPEPTNLIHKFMDHLSHALLFVFGARDIHVVSMPYMIYAKPDVLRKTKNFKSLPMLSKNSLSSVEIMTFGDFAPRFMDYVAMWKIAFLMVLKSLSNKLKKSYG